MSDMKLDLAFWNYDRTRALSDGTIKIDGVDASFHSARIVPEIFEQMIRHRAYDVSELGMTYFLRAMEVEPAFLALPVFPTAPFGTQLSISTKRAASSGPRILRGPRSRCPRGYARSRCRPSR